MTQLEVIKQFMKTLSDHNFTAATNDGSKYSPAKAMLDEAIRACSHYDGIDDAIQKFLTAIKNSSTRNEAFTVCGIDTTNADTGGITGFDEGSSAEQKTSDTTVLEVGNFYSATDGARQIIYTGDNGWLVQATSLDDTIFAQGEDSINAGAGDDQIILSGRTAVLLTGGNNDTVSVEAGVKNFVIKDFNAATVLLGAQNFSSVATANDDGSSIVSFTKSNVTDSISNYDSATHENYQLSANLADDQPPVGDSAQPRKKSGDAADRSEINFAVPDPAAVYSVNLSDVNTLKGYFTADGNFVSVTTATDLIGSVESKFDSSYLDVDANGKLSFTYRGLKLNIKGFREGNELTGPITAQNIDALNDNTSANYYQWIIISGLYKWWLKESLDLNDEANGINFYDGGATVNEIDLYFERDDDSGWLAYVSRSSSNGKAVHLDLVINSKYFSGLTSDTDPNCDGYITFTENGSSYLIGGRLDRTIAHEFNHAVFGANVNFFGKLPMFIKEGMAELIHGVDDKRIAPMNELLDNAVNTSSETATYLDSRINLNLNNSTQEATLSGGSSKSSYSYAGGYMFLRWLAKTASEV